MDTILRTTFSKASSWVNEKSGIISDKFVLEGMINIKSPLVQGMTWHCNDTNPLAEPTLNLKLTDVQSLGNEIGLSYSNLPFVKWNYDRRNEDKILVLSTID